MSNLLINLFLESTNPELENKTDEAEYGMLPHGPASRRHYSGNLDPLPS